MSHIPEYAKNEFADDEKRHINKIIGQILVSFSHHKVPAEIAAASLMISAATVCALSEDTIDDITDKFRLCLLDARTRGKTPQ